MARGRHHRSAAPPGPVPCPVEGCGRTLAECPSGAHQATLAYQLAALGLAEDQLMAAVVTELRAAGAKLRARLAGWLR